LVLVIGTTATFDYIVEWALRPIRKQSYLIEINPEETLLSSVADISIRKKGAIELPELFDL